MQASFTNGAREFLSVAGRLLTTDEARYGLISSIAKRLAVNPHFYGPEDPWFCVVSDATGICAVAIRTPPFRVLLASFSGDAESAARVLTEVVARRSPAIPGTTGDVGITDSFAEQWCTMRQVHIVGKQAQRIYRLDRVNETTYAPGRLRLGTLADRDLLSAWQAASTADIYGVLSSKVPPMDITPAIQRKDVFVWEHGVPVSMAGKTRPTESGITVSMVYTPPEFRRKGYATSCVSSLCTELLRGGYRFCTLYTDLANPTSNSIYSKIGFNEVSDSVEYSFSE